MIRRIVLAILVVLCGLGWPPAWADYGGEWSAVEPIEAKITLEIHPLHAQVWLDGFWLGTALDITNIELTMLRGRHVVDIGAPGFRTRKVFLDATTLAARRIWVDLIPDRKP